MEATSNAYILLLGKPLGLMSVAGGGDMEKLYLQASWLIQIEEIHKLPDDLVWWKNGV